MEKTQADKIEEFGKTAWNLIDKAEVFCGKLKLKFSTTGVGAGSAYLSIEYPGEDFGSIEIRIGNHGSGAGKHQHGTPERYIRTDQGEGWKELKSIIKKYAEDPSKNDESNNQKI